MADKEKKKFYKIRTISAQAIRPFEEFFKLESAGGIALVISMVLALLWANSPWEWLYKGILQTKISIGIGEYILAKPMILWINDGLMAIFFFVVGLEIKREVVVGELSSVRKSALPIGAAVGGMVVPALIYLLFNGGTRAAAGWGIPMATDIAFALGCISLISKSVPRTLALFLTAVAIVDDIGAVLVIAMFYTSHISYEALSAALIITLILLLGNKFNVQKIPFYLILGVLLWFAVLKSGVHATIAGVLLGMLIPVESENEKASILHQLEHTLHPWVTFFIMPVFALANAGVRIEWGTMAELLVTPLSLGIILGLFLGKQVGITAFAYLMVRLGWAELPRKVKWGHIYGAALLGGIGFTMSLFITSLAFTDETMLSAAKIAIIVGSFISAMAGLGLLKWVGARQERKQAVRST